MQHLTQNARYVSLTKQEKAARDVQRNGIQFAVLTARLTRIDASWRRRIAGLGQILNWLIKECASGVCAIKASLREIIVVKITMCNRGSGKH